MKTLPICFVLAAAAAGAAEPVRELTAADWDRPRSGDFVTGIPVLRDTMQAVDRPAGRHLRIRHPGGEQGLLWAEELRGWLVALGLGSSRIHLVPGAGRPDVLELVVETP